MNKRAGKVFALDYGRLMGDPICAMAVYNPWAHIRMPRPTSSQTGFATCRDRHMP